ncbi:MAG: Rpn family recombination-promoting nuclease/putative transposase [Firmicutes bacterium]|nr:Rpn family recombination-promoting nuclease/putative transposase [Bacillota bacterium]
MNTEIKGKRSYQDSVFRMLFSDKESAIELFNAFEGTDYDENTDVEFTTLEDALYHGIKNDLGFLIDSNRFIMLSEHQSTINENMPMRQLQYVAKTYERILDKENLSQKGRVMIPAPTFYVLYTGEENWEKSRLCLSESYASDPGENTLELVVKIIDLRYNIDNPILKRSEKLMGYSYLLYTIRENRKLGMELGIAISQAVDTCIREDILSAFLIKHRSEVGSMLYYDISEERFIEIRVKEAEANALREGRERGRAEGCAEGRKEGILKSLKMFYGLKLSREQAIEELCKEYDEEEVLSCIETFETMNKGEQ